MKRVANKDARTHVQNRKEFEGSNTFAEWSLGKGASEGSPRRYIVYSYGKHWPLFIWENGVWYENADRASVSTSKHRTQLHPHTQTRPLGKDAMVDIARLGFSGLVASRLNREEVSR